MWFKVDDDLYMHPKVVQAGNLAMGLWVRAGAWSARMLTDGVVVPEQVAALGDPRQTCARRLVDVGLWVPGPGGSYAFHEWELWQPSRAVAEAVKARREESGREGNHLRWHVRRGVVSPDCKWCQASAGRRNTDR